MPVSGIASSSFANPARPIPATPVAPVVIVGATPGDIQATVTIPTVDTGAAPLTGVNKVNKIYLYWSLQALPATIEELSSSAQPTIHALFNAVDAAVLGTTVFQFTGTNPGQPVYISVFASND